MSRRTIRVLLVLAIAGSLWIRHVAISDRDGVRASYDPTKAVADVVRAHGLVLRDNPFKAPLLHSVIVYFERKGCMAPSLAMPFLISQEAMPLLSRVISSEHRVSFHYFDHSWPTQSRTAIFAAWVREEVLAFIGRSRFMPVRTAIVVADPAGCNGGARIDWAPVWDRARHAATLGAAM